MGSFQAAEEGTAMDTFVPLFGLFLHFVVLLIIAAGN
jgi:hypothetical protein